MSGSGGRRWTDDEAEYVTTWLPYRTVPAIARRLRRTEKAVRRWMERHGQFPTTQHLLTSGEMSRETGLSPQYLTRLARAGKVQARRVPGGRWWLFAQETPPRR